LPTIEHSVLESAERHEPKGVEDASNGMRYTSDGAGSGSWQYIPTGWGNYGDNASEQTFTTAQTKLSINKLGTVTNEAYLPLAIRGTGTLWSSDNNRITSIAQGDKYMVRVILPVTARSAANYIELELDIGASEASVTFSVLKTRLECSRTPPFSISLSFPLFSLDTFMANGCSIWMNTDTGSLGVTAPQIMISREHTEVT